MQQLELAEYTKGYPANPGHRGVDTSIAAAESIKPTAKKWEKEIISALKDNGAMTFWEIASVTGICFDNSQPCVSRMKAAGKVIDSGERRKNPNGRNSIVWRLP